MATEIIGWAAAIVLLITLSTQVVKQWYDRTSQGVSPWLFAGQVVASAGFTAYSILVGNTVFAVTNVLILLSALLGQMLFWRNQGTMPAALQKVATRLGLPPRKRKPDGGA